MTDRPKIAAADVEEFRTWCLNNYCHPHADAVCDLALRGLEQQWVSVDERLPEIGSTVLTWKPSSEIWWICCYSDEAHFHRTSIRRDGQWWDKGREITHWMPLPAPPTGGKL